MERALLILVLFMAMVIPAWAGESPDFDPDQPLREGVTKNLLRSWLQQALDVLDEHVEISASLVPDETSGDRRNHLRFTFFPDGKSKSHESYTAEGWIERSPDGRQQDLHFRFKHPDSSPQGSSLQFEPVL
ncbi:MAG: hypothetical protein ACT4OL_11775 [Nitrospiraceae bacterium]